MEEVRKVEDTIELSGNNGEDKLKKMFETPWEFILPATQVYGNLFFVGNEDGASWLVKTEKGLLLFDTNYPTAAALLVDSIWRLGFDPCDIIAIFHTHGHYDHFGATSLLQNMSGAKSYLGREDAKMFRENPKLALIPESLDSYLAVFEPDIEVNDGDEFQFGKTVVRAVSCPGHSQGATSYFFNVEDEDGRSLKAGLHGGSGLNTLCADFRRMYHVDWRANFADSIEKVIEEPVDIFLGNHTEQGKVALKIEERQKGEMNAFVDSTEWKKFLTDLRSRFQEMLRREDS